MLAYGIPLEFRGGVHLFIYKRHTPSGQSRVRVLPWQVTMVEESTGGLYWEMIWGIFPAWRRSQKNEILYVRLRLFVVVLIYSY